MHAGIFHSQTRGNVLHHPSQIRNPQTQRVYTFSRVSPNVELIFFSGI